MRPLAGGTKLLSLDDLDLWLSGWLFEPNAQVRVQPSSEWGGGYLTVSLEVEDTYNPGQTIRVGAAVPLPSHWRHWDQRDFAAFVRTARHQMATHESDEWFRDRLSGRPLFDPHAKDQR